MATHFPSVYTKMHIVLSSSVALKIVVNNDRGRFDDSCTNRIELSMSARLAHVVSEFCLVGTVIILYYPLPLRPLWAKEMISFSTVDFVFCEYSPNSNQMTLCKYTLMGEPISSHSSHSSHKICVDICVPNSLKK